MATEPIPQGQLPALPQLTEENLTDAAATYGRQWDAMNRHQQATYRAQTAYLEAYAVKGEGATALKFARVARQTAHHWIQADLYGFRERLEDAKAAFADRLETIAHNRVELQKPNDNPVLLITLLNANRPEKYRPTSQPIDDTVKAVLTTLQEVGSAALAARTPPAALQSGGSRGEQGEGTEVG